MNILFMGLGRIGLPQALVFASSGHIVYGYDHDTELIKLLENKITPFYEPDMENLLNSYINKSFYPIKPAPPVINIFIILLRCIQ